jgi:hypothetical protein
MSEPGVIDIRTDGTKWTFDSHEARSILELAQVLLTAGYDPETRGQMWQGETFLGNTPPLGLAAVPSSERLNYLRGRRG